MQIEAAGILKITPSTYEFASSVPFATPVGTSL
jgi:hypothetical protein